MIIVKIKGHIKHCLPSEVLELTIKGSTGFIVNELIKNIESTDFLIDTIDLEED